MKSIEQVQSEEFGDVFTMEQFADMVEEGGIIPYDGNGYFHDGEKKNRCQRMDSELDMG